MMKDLIVIFCSVVWFAKVSICLRIVSVSVPALKPRAEPATLICDYDLEGSRLYSIKWYRDNEEFYRYMPRLRPPQHAHALDGVIVDLHKSSARRVHLRELTLKSRGVYRCEVSEEAPSFHSVQAEAFLEVYYFPREAPKITGYERRYDPNEPLDVNCTSGKAFPAPELHWQVNGQKVSDIWTRTYDTIEETHGLLMSRIGLLLPAQPKMRLRCTATIGTHKRERTVVIETNGGLEVARCSPFFILVLLIQSFYYLCKQCNEIS